MANAKISALTGLAAADVAPATDVLPIVDTSVTTTKKITVTALGQSIIVIGTEQASTSGTELDFTIPAGAKKIVVLFAGVSTSGTSEIQIQLGDAGGIETSGYLSASARFADATAVLTSNGTAGFMVMPTTAQIASAVWHGRMELNLENVASFRWIASWGFGRSDGSVTTIGAGSKATSAELTTVRITTVNGSDTFDAGAINVQYT